jgi:hypothetical protein
MRRISFMLMMLIAGTGMAAGLGSSSSDLNKKSATTTHPAQPAPKQPITPIIQQTPKPATVPAPTPKSIALTSIPASPVADTKNPTNSTVDNKCVSPTNSRCNK